ncbi:outer membrane protein insertion porin family [Hydrogenivirga caldilitoris]|uniref:Outer membrane protein insertion porin family n=1 Tax=Hydrogenivirga caldilitoris TaxID=246264 RepID=A0A497XTE7_9AQUI|nr:outer membrane protein assembly factor [Hydrogenivirga caldilitoris]RLJ71359.1 outer membrane protein insertion porin family [Hydrogenivirga caldilitoris]
MKYILLLLFLISSAFPKVFIESNYPLRNNNFSQILEKEGLAPVLWALQRLKDVKDIRISTVGPDTVIYVERYPIVKEVEIEGNWFVSDEEIENIVLVREGEALVNFDPDSARETLKLFYSREGFLDADVDIKIDIDERGYARVKFKVREGDLYFFKGAKFFGAKSFPEDRLTYETGLLIGDVFNEEAARKGVRNLYDFYRKKGFLESSVYYDGIEKEKLSSSFPRVLFPGVEGAKRSVLRSFIPLFRGMSNLISHPIAVTKALFGSGSVAFPRYIVNEGSHYNIVFEGNSHFDGKTLLSLLDLDTPGVDIFFLEKSKNDIIRFYRDKGFFDVKVDYAFGERGIRFLIEEGQRYSLKVLGFKGIRLPDDYDRELIEQRVQSFLDKVRSEGYLTAQVKLYEDINRERKQVYLVVDYIRGKRVWLRGVHYTGEDQRIEEIIGRYNALTPRIFEGNYIEELNRDIMDFLKSEGYLDGDFSVKIDVSEDKDNMYLTYFYSVNKGERYRYGELLVYGNEKTHFKEIYYTVVKEEFYSTQAEEESLWNLIQSENYVGVRTENFVDRESKRVYRLVEVREDKRGLFELSGGYNTEEKLKVEGGVKLKNLFGVGIILSLKGAKSQKYETYEAELSDKFLFSRKYFASISAFRRLEFHNNYDLESDGHLVSVGYRLSRWFSMSAFYSGTRNDVSGTGAGRFNLRRFGFFLVREIRDDLVNPKNLTHNSFRVSRVSGDREYYRVEVNNFILREVIKGLSVNGKLAGGWTGKEAPIFDRFFLGGLRDMKGYDFESIGSPEGGRTFLFGRLELLFVLREPLWLGLYTDSGNAADTFSEALHNLKYDVGTAVGVNTPAGFIRLDVAKPLSKVEEPTSKFKVYLSIGFVY